MKKKTSNFTAELCSWFEQVFDAHKELTPEQLQELAIWERDHPEELPVDWPGFIPIVGRKRPRPVPKVPRRKTA